jgi:hypothetical protein
MDLISQIQNMNINKSITEGKTYRPRYVGNPIMDVDKSAHKNLMICLKLEFAMPRYT